MWISCVSPFHLDLGSAGENVKLLDSQKFVSNFSGTNVKTQLNTVSVERGMSWQQAMNKWHQHDGPDDGFYISAQVRDTLVLHLQWDLSSIMSPDCNAMYTMFGGVIVIW